MEPYRVGALAELISSQTASDEPVKSKKSFKKSLDSFFTSRLPPVLPQPESPIKRPKTEKTLEKSLTFDNKRKISQWSEQVATQPKKSKSKVTPLGYDSDDDDEPEYTKPSLRFQVREEDAKARNKARDEEKESRTIFVGNLPGKTTEKTIRKLFKEFGDIETVRFRGAARPDPKTTKKVAIITRKLHENHQHIIAYVRYKTREEATKSLALNGTALEDGSVIRVDMATTTKADRDQKKAIFVGNIPFTAEEDHVRKHFECCGKIDSVRIIRDPTTGMGKGFGYVNFASVDSVETAMQRDQTELLGRAIRVTRAVRRPKTTLSLAEKVKKNKLAKGSQKPVMVTKKVVKVGRKKQKEAVETSFQGQTADGSKSKGDKPAAKKRNKGEIKMKRIAAKFAKS